MLIAPPPGVAAMCDCTDANRNDLAGLVRMATVLQDTQSDESVPVVLATRPHQDIDVSGDYETTLQVGEERSTLSVRVELVRKRKRG